MMADSRKFYLHTMNFEFHGKKTSKDVEKNKKTIHEG